ncbi:MAG: prepilin-type N-terminal cleavage/methylation domain-containing protein [Pirellula sp.]|jgi:prepilin-type N-terminal cleavage/methylation domain-containing protein
MTSSRRNAFTLFEVILVLIILVVIAAIAFPTLDAMIYGRRLLQSTERLQNELLEARVEAMRTGQVQVFRATINGNSYSIGPWLSGNEDSDASAGATVMNAGGLVKTERTSGGAVGLSTGQLGGDAKQLAGDVQFMGIETLVDARNALELQKNGEVAPIGGVGTAVAGGISSPLLMYPDGSSTTAQIILADSRGRRMALQLRGVTGKSTSVRLTSVDAGSIPSVAPGPPVQGGF